VKKILLIFLFLSFSWTAHAVQPDEMLQDPVLEARAREIAKNLRCPVCQGEAIDESQAPLAGDLRKLVRERIVAGDTDAQALAYIQERYGDYILMSPPVSPKNLLLWLSPFLVILIGGGIVFRVSRKGAV